MYPSHDDDNALSPLKLSSTTTLVPSAVASGYDSYASGLTSLPSSLRSSSATLVPGSTGVHTRRHRRTPQASTSHGHATGAGARKKKNFSTSVRDLNEIYGVVGWPTVSPTPEEAFFVKPRRSSSTPSTRTRRARRTSSSSSSSITNTDAKPLNDSCSSSSSLPVSSSSSESRGLLPLLSSLNLLRHGLNKRDQKRQRQRRSATELLCSPSLSLIKSALSGTPSLSSSRRSSISEQKLKMGRLPQ